MLVKNWMSKNVVTIDAEDSIGHAVDLRKKYGFRMFPVLDKGQLVGILSDSDIKSASPSKASILDVHELLYLVSKIKIRDIMNKEPVTVPPDFTVEETAQVMMEKKISGVPVVDQGKVIGIITRDDLFKVLVSLSGLGKKGIQFALQLEDRPGSIKEVTDILREFGGRLASILTSYDDVPAGYRFVYIRAYDLDRSKLTELKESLMQKRLLHVVDHLQGEREILSEPGPVEKMAGRAKA